MINTKAPKDERFTQPLYTITEAANYLKVPRSTFETWVHGYVRKSEKPVRRHTRSAAIVTAIPKNRRSAEIPFIGLAEGMVAAAFRRTGVSMQEIRRALTVLSNEIGVPHALASKNLYTDGARILYDYATEQDIQELGGLTVVVSRQRVFAPVIKDYLKRIYYAHDGWASKLKLPHFESVIVDPHRSFGQPIFVRGGVRIEDVVDRFKAGESIKDVAKDFGVPSGDVEEVIRGSLSSAA